MVKVLILQLNLSNPCEEDWSLVGVEPLILESDSSLCRSVGWVAQRVRACVSRYAFLQNRAFSTRSVKNAA